MPSYERCALATIRLRADFFCLNTCTAVINGLYSSQHMQRGVTKMALPILIAAVLALFFLTVCVAGVLEMTAPNEPHPDLHKINFPVVPSKPEDIERRH